jgi:tetratricopeptide (TPR) repeat protein
MRLLFKIGFISTFLICTAAGQMPAVEPQPKTAAERYQEGLAAHQRGDHKAAREALEEAKRLSEAGPAESRARYEVLRALAAVQSATGDYEGAEQSLERAVNWRERYERAVLVDLSAERLELASVLEWSKQYERALALLVSIEQQYARQTRDVVDPRLADVYSRQAQIYSAIGEKTLAVYASERSLRVRSAQLGDWHIWLTTELERLGVYALHAREYAKAEEAYQRALLIREKAQGRDHIDLVSSLDGLAYALYGQKKHAEAEQVYLRLLKSWTDTAGVEHPMVILTLDKMASLYRDWGREADGEAAEARAVALRALFHANGLTKRAGELVRQKQLKDAVATYRKALALLDESRSEHAELRAKLAKSLSELAPRRPAVKPATAPKQSSR